MICQKSHTTVTKYNYISYVVRILTDVKWFQYSRSKKHCLVLSGWKAFQACFFFWFIAVFQVSKSPVKFNRKCVAEFTTLILTKNQVKTKVQCGALCSKNNFENQNELCNTFQFVKEKMECKIGNLNLHHMSINGNEEVIKSD